MVAKYDIHCGTVRYFTSAAATLYRTWKTPSFQFQATIRQLYISVPSSIRVNRINKFSTPDGLARRTTPFPQEIFYSDLLVGSSERLFYTLCKFFCLF